MKFTFTDKKIGDTQTFRYYAEKKVGKIDRFFKDESEAFITFSIEKGRNKVEVTIKNNGVYYRVTETTHDMNASIDSAVAAIERQIRKNKTRLEKKLREGAFEREVKDVIDEESADEGEFNVVKTKRFSVKPMSVDEAILRMNLLEHQFFVFRNEADDEFAVVYKRNDGDYGLIECIGE